MLEEEKQAVQDVLDDTNVSSLEDLRKLCEKNPVGFHMLCAAGTKSGLVENYDAILKLIASRPAEEVLNDLEILGHEAAGLPDHEINLDFQPTGSFSTSREGNPPPILVLGSSGSGKTTFAAKSLRGRLKKDLEAERVVTVYLTGDAVRPEDQDASTATEGEIESAEEQAAKSAIDGVRKVFNPKVGSFSKPLDMLLILVIDEVGLACDTAWMGTKWKLTRFATKLQELAVKVQLVLAGTGLDKITSSVNSNQDFVRIRMQPWTFEDVKWWAYNCLRGVPEQKKRIVDTVSSTPILKLLATNARAAKFLLDALAKYDLYFDREALIDHVVTTVAFMYIKANSLKDLSATERHRVAKLVLTAFSDAKKGGTQTSPPDFGEESGKVQRAFYSLVDTHVEKDQLVSGHNFAVSTSPAIAIVLTALMGCISTLSSSWSGFERVVALSELQRCFVTSDEGSAPRLVRLRLPYPQTNFKDCLKVPNLVPTSVAVNGPGAPYTDVIGHKRFIQCKHAISIKGLAKVDLKKELKKMGVLKNEHYRGDECIQNRFLTHLLMKQWNQLGGRPPCSESRAEPAPVSRADSDNTDIPDDGTRSMYPMGLLDVTETPDDDDFCEYRLIGGKFYLKGSQKETPWDRTQFEQEITIVFSTNTKGFNVNWDQSGVSFDLLRRHLHDDGQIRREKTSQMNIAILNHLDGLVDTNKVKIRFEVCSH